MTFDEKLDRINALAQKAKKEGLTATEKEEQQRLRQDYLKNLRESFTNQFKTMTIIDPEGHDVTPKKIKDLQDRNKKH